MIETINGITVGTRYGEERYRDPNFRLLAMLTTHTAVAPNNAPPGTPVANTLYIVGTAGSGAFAGHNNQLAYYDQGTWQFFTPQTGMKMNALTWNGTAWA